MGEALDFKTLEKMGQVVVEEVALEMRMFLMLMQNGRGVGVGRLPGMFRILWCNAPLSGPLENGP